MIPDLIIIFAATLCHSHAAAPAEVSSDPPFVLTLHQVGGEFGRIAADSKDKAHVASFLQW
jgi:hypothetical protein